MSKPSARQRPKTERQTNSLQYGKPNVHTSAVPGHLLTSLEKADEHRVENFSDKSKLLVFGWSSGR